MKTCSVEGCISYVFGRNLCVKHWKEKYQKPIPTTLKKCNKIAPKRLKQVQRYNLLIRDRDAVTHNPTCFFCGCKITSRISHHHIVGRDGDNLTDEKYIANACHQCHFQWHNWSVRKLAKEYWWEEYLLRLRAMDEGEYQKTLKKFDK